MTRTFAIVAVAAVLAGCSEMPTAPSAALPSESFALSPSHAPALTALALPVAATYTDGPNSCPHGAPGGFNVDVTGSGGSVVFSWNPAPSIHVYEISVERYDVTNRWLTVEGFPHAFQDVKSVQWWFKDGGRYRAFIRVHTNCGDFGGWSDEFKFSLNEAAIEAPGRVMPVTPPFFAPKNECYYCHIGAR